MRFLDNEMFSKFYDLSGKEIINERQKAIVDSYSVLQNLSKERQLVLQVKDTPPPQTNKKWGIYFKALVISIQL